MKCKKVRHSDKMTDFFGILKHFKTKVKMAANKIVTRVKDFLKQHPPFSFLPEAVLLKAAENVEVFYFSNNEYIFTEAAPNQNYAYVLKKGKVEILKQFKDGKQLIDICETGDVFGVRSLLTGKPYLTTARVSGDALIYAIPRHIAEPVVNEYPQVALFFAAGFAAGQTIVHSEFRASQQARKDLLHLQKRKISGTFSEEDILVLNPIEDIVSCNENTTIQEAAEKMSKRRVGSIIVIDENNLPIGMVTDTDFTRKVIAGKAKVEDSITNIMTAPVVTTIPETTIAQFTMLSIRRNVRRIIVTKDGTNLSPVIGILSDRDVLTMHGNNPAVLIKRMLKARSIQKLKKLRDRADDLILNYLEQEIAIEFISDIITEINDVLVQRAIAFSIEKLEIRGVENPNLKWAWLSLGSEGRREQLLRTDQDNAIIYENPTEGLEAIAKIYFFELVKAIVDILIQCGFSPCKGEIMASNPKWNQPLDGWKTHFRNWIQNPEPDAVLNGNIFFDFRIVFGSPTLANDLSDFIFETVDKSSGAFARFFVSNAMDSPAPLSFFKNFVVERSGKHKDMFDIKQRAMMPLAGAARMLMIAEKVKGINNTFERYRKLAELYPNEKELFEEAAMAYEIFMRYRAIQGFKNNDSGRFIAPAVFNKIERQTLRTAFQSIEGVQRYLKFRFAIFY
jgi:CBS domain-containing protein